jgi:hypothetical protein
VFLKSPVFSKDVNHLADVVEGDINETIRFVVRLRGLGLLNKVLSAPNSNSGNIKNTSKK